MTAATIRPVSLTNNTGVNSGVGTAVTCAPAAGTVTSDYQIAIMLISSGTPTISAQPPAAWTALTPTGGDTVSSLAGSGADDHGGSMRIAVYESKTAGTASFTATLSASANWAVIRLSFVLPSGSAGRTVALGKTLETGNGTTSHPLPAVTTTAPDSLVIGLAAMDMPAPQTFTGLGTFTSIVQRQQGTGNPSLTLVAASKLIAAPTSGVTDNFVTSTLDTIALYSIVVNGVTSTPVPVVNAGADATVTVNNAFTRTATEDGSPTSRAWTIVSGPAGAGTTIGTAAALSWTPTTVGNYVLRYTATNAGGPGSDDINVSVIAAPTAPVVGAGADVTNHPVSTVFSRTATENDGGSAITSRAWTIQSGPAGAGTTIGTSAALSWTPNTAGTYVLRYTATNGIGTSFDEASITVVLPAAPTANAGADVASHTVSTAFTRTATETGTGITSREWSVVSGPVGAGDILSTAALLSWTPQTTGAYVLQYRVTNAGGTAADTMAITVNPAPVSGKPNTFVVQHAEKIAATTTTNSAPLPSAPRAGALVISVMSGNKQVTTMTQPAGFTKRASYTGVSVSGALADGSANPGAWNYGGGNLTDNSAVGSFEMNITGWSFSSAAQFPNPANDDPVATLSGDLGATPVNGTIFCLVGVDSAYLDASSAWTRGASITFSNGYTEIGRIIQPNNNDNAESGPNAQGVAFILAKKDVAVGDTTNTTVSWSGGTPASVPDQAYMILAEYAVSETDGVPPVPPSGTAGTLTSAWRGIDAINLRLAGGSGDVRVDFSTSSNMSSPINSALVSPDSQGNAHVPIPGNLTPNTAYYYQAFRGGSYIGTAQQITTLPAPDQQSSFSFGFASCRNSDVDSPIITNAITRGADMFLEIGDLFYDNVSTNNPAGIRDGYDDALGKTNISTVFKTLATAYVWDDHDYGGDASNGGTASKPAANLVYRERVPHVELPATDGVYHTFKVGRARFIMLDCRAFRSPVGQTPDDANKTMLGAAQKAWLKDLLANPDTPLTFVISPVAWHSSLNYRADDEWGFYLTEQAEIAAAVSAAATECVFLCGDMHKLAIATPAQNTPGGVHVWQAAPLNCFDNDVKGGPYRETPLYGQSQYGFVDVTDTGTSMTVTFSAIKGDGTVWNTDTVSLALAPVVVAGIDATIPHHQTFVRTAAESGSGITTRQWSIVSGPAGVATGVIGTGATLTWVPPKHGVYVLQYLASNAAGTGTDTMTLTVTQVTTPMASRSGFTPTLSRKLKRVTRAPKTIITATGSTVSEPTRLSVEAERLAALVTVDQDRLIAIHPEHPAALATAAVIGEPTRLGHQAGRAEAVTTAVGELATYAGISRAISTATGHLRVISRVSVTAEAVGTTSRRLQRTTRGGGSATASITIHSTTTGRIRDMSAERAPFTTRSWGQTNKVSVGHVTLSVTAVLSPAHARTVAKFRHIRVEAITLAQVGRIRKIVITTANAIATSPQNRSRNVHRITGYVTALGRADGNLVWAPIRHLARATVTMEGGLLAVKPHYVTLAAPISISTDTLRIVAMMSTVLAILDKDGDIIPRTAEQPRAVAEPTAPEPIVYTRTFTRLR